MSAAVWPWNWPKPDRTSTCSKKIPGLPGARINHRVIQVFCMRAFIMSRIFVPLKRDCVLKETACGTILQKNTGFPENKPENCSWPWMRIKAAGSISIFSWRKPTAYRMCARSAQMKSSDWNPMSVRIQLYWYPHPRLSIRPRCCIKSMPRPVTGGQFYARNPGR